MAVVKGDMVCARAAQPTMNAIKTTVQQLACSETSKK